LLQKTIAEQVTRMVHSEEDLQKAIQASQILFGRSTAEDLKKLDRQTFLEVFEGVPQAEISLSDLNQGIDMIGLLAAKTSFLKSNGEARRALGENSISVNKIKVDESYHIGSSDLIDDQYILLQRGKKNYFIVKVVA
jgi:tyrosyl-tRNA synthetase